MSQREGTVSRQRSVESGLTQAIRPMLICASESSIPVQAPEQLSVPQTAETRMAKMKKKISSSPLLKRKNISGGVMINRTFGVPVEELLKRSDGCEVPFIITTIVEYLEKHALNHEGIFRISGNHKVVENLKAAFDRDGDANLEQTGDVMAVAGLLKLFLRELPDPLIPQNMTMDFIRVHKVHKDAQSGLSELKQLLEKLPDCNFLLLKYLCRFLVKVANNEENNKMSAMSLAIVFGPNFFRCSDGIEGLREQGHTNAVVCRFLQDFDELFEVSPYATTDIFRVQEAAKGTESLALSFSRSKHVQKVANESSAGDENPSHADKGNLAEDGPIYATVKKSNKNLQASLHASSRSEDLEMYVRSVSPPWSTQHNNDASGTAEPKNPAGKEIVQNVIQDTIKEHLFGPDMGSTDENSPYSPESGDEGPPLPPREYTREESGKQRRKRRKNARLQKESPVVEDVADSSEKQDSTSVTKATEVLKNQSTVETERGLKVEVVIRPVKKRPKSKEFELFEEKDTVIGLDKNSNIILNSMFPQSKGSRGDTEDVLVDYEDDIKDLENEQVDDLFKVRRNSEVLESLTRGRAPPPKNRRRPSWKKRHGATEEVMDKLHPTHKPSKPLVHPLVEEAKNKDVVSSPPPKSPRSSKGSRLLSSTMPREEGDVDDIDAVPLRPRKELLTKQYKKKHHSSPIVPPLELYKLQQEESDDIQLSPRERYDYGYNVEEAMLSPRSRPLTIDTRTSPTECPPSPPHEQFDHFWLDRRMETSPKSELTVKQLTKTIHQLKKKIRDFEDTFEDEHARRPTQSEKAPIKKYVTELGIARKQLKELKERAKKEAERLNETVPPMSGQGTSSTTDEPLLTTTPASIQHSLDGLLSKLEEKRQEGDRPEAVEYMTREQLTDEKLAVQKALLQHESLFGRPTLKRDKDIMRPLYDRYRIIKRKLATTPAVELPMKVPGGTRPRTSSMERMVSDLAPIHEDAPLHSSGDSPTTRAMTQSLPLPGSKDSPRRRSAGLDVGYTGPLDANDEQILSDTVELQDTLNASDAAQTREDAKFHEMSQTELRDQLEIARKEKKKLRKKLKKFEDEFFEQSGRRVQREDRGDMEKDYHEYKHIKHQLRLIEALLTKRQGSQTL